MAVGLPIQGGPMSKTAAGIVAFRPNPGLFLPLVRTLEQEVEALFVFVNDELEAATLDALRATRARIIESPYNLGIGEGFNQLALHAILADHERLAIFDDDSGIHVGAVAALNATMDALQARGEKPAVVGPKIVSPAHAPHEYRPPRYFGAGGAVGSAQSVLYVISSGSLIDLDAFRRVGRFRSDFFMDAIDTEWCFRARARGFSCWVDAKVEMEHRIGGGVTRRTIFGRGFPKQTPMRMHAYIRNQVYCLGLPHLPLWWRVLLTAHLFRLCGGYTIGADNKREAAHLVRMAVREGWAQRLGPPPQAENAVHLHDSTARLTEQGIVGSTFVKTP
jgi:rhamnosyltransferase